VPTPDENVIVVGAGPYGLAATLQLRRRGASVRTFGDPLGFWRRMPPGMFLRSNRSATNMIENHGPHSLDAFAAETGTAIAEPVPLETFLAYGDWVQRTAVPDVDRRMVAEVARSGSGFAVRLDDGEELTASRVVVAGGIAPFTWRPPEFAALPASLASHTSDHTDLSVFSGRTVAIIGGGQSALESAALLAEQGATPSVSIRRPGVVWLRGQGVKRRIGRLGPIVYAPTDVGPLWYSRLVERPDSFRLLPRAAQDRIARRCIRPAGSNFVRVRLTEVPIELDAQLVKAEPIDDRLQLAYADGSTRLVDHVMFGTGFRIDVAKYGILSDDVLARLEAVGGYPVLGRGFESSVAGLHFLGAPAARSFGPIMRFISGSWFGAHGLATEITGSSTTGDT
jgi:FAD-dependent urate hydroxylase